MDPGELRKVLDRIGVRPNRRLGQNFLCDGEVAEWIVEQLDPQAGDTVVEAGPGTGALTEHLAGRVRRLILIEKDARLAGYLREKFAGPGIDVIEGDATEFDPRVLYPSQPVKLIGNLPYSAGGEIIRNFLSSPTPVSAAVIMVQKEVCDRLCAVPKTKDYGAFTVRVQSRWTAQPLRVLGPELFHPQPAIDSSILRLDPRPVDAFPPYDRALFERFVSQGFAQRRKQLKNRLPEMRERWPEVSALLGVAETARAEELSVEQWVALTNALDPEAPAAIDDTAGDLFDVVDEEDEVTGQAPRAEVHERKLRHRAVHLFVFNRAGELFLQKRSHLKDKFPGRWDSSASGHLDAGEEYGEAAQREIREELGMAGGEMEWLGKIEASEATGWEFVQLYRAAVKGKMSLAPTEIECGAYFPMETICEWIEARPEDFAPGFGECLRLYQKTVHGGTG